MFGSVFTRLYLRRHVWGTSKIVFLVQCEEVEVLSVGPPGPLWPDPTHAGLSHLCEGSPSGEPPREASKGKQSIVAVQLPSFL